jgi:hypothetical protein
MRRHPTAHEGAPSGDDGGAVRAAPPLTFGVHAPVTSS